MTSLILFAVGVIGLSEPDSQVVATTFTSAVAVVVAGYAVVTKRGRRLYTKTAYGGHVNLVDVALLSEETEGRKRTIVHLTLLFFRSLPPLPLPVLLQHVAAVLVGFGCRVVAQTTPTAQRTAPPGPSHARTAHV